jgi:anti-sigma B factor antagonist
MSLKIAERSVRDVTVLDISGRLTQGEESSAFRDVVRRLLAHGHNKILVNLFGVDYIDSTGLGTVFSSNTSVRNQGGSLKLLNLTKKVHDLLQVTKLYMVCEVFVDEDEAIKSFEFPRFRGRCPVCGNLVLLVRREGGIWTPALCDKCDAGFSVVAAAGVTEEVFITSLRIQTYMDEYLEILPGSPFTLNIIGRLDLFSSSAVTKAWGLLPSPRKVILDLGGAEIDGDGLETLIALSTHTKDDEKLAVPLDSVFRQTDIFPAGPPFYRSRAAALEALGSLRSPSRWPVRVWKT